MITYSIIQKSRLEGGLRLDAEYYQPEYLKLIDNLNMLGAVPVGEVATNLKRKFKPQKGELFQYIEISEVDLSTGEYNKAEILGENAPDRAQWIVKQNDVIVSTVRPIRNAVSLIREDVKNLVCSSGFAVLKPEKIEPEYLFAYLKSQPIVKLLDRKTTATMYPAVTIEDILETKICLGDQAFRKEIVDAVIEAQRELGSSRYLYSQAENLLLEELGMKDFEIDDDLSYIVNLSEVKSARRADAEYFQPKYKKIISKLKSQNAKLLGELVGRVKIKIKPKSEEIYKYIEISDVNIGSGDVGFNEIIGKELPANARIPIKGGELLISKVRPTRGAISIVPFDFNYNFICSGAFSVFKAAEVLKEYLFVVLRSVVGKLQFEEPTTGTSYPTITDEDVENILVPVLPKPTQQKIADSVRKSHEARSKAKQLLEQAKGKIENLIEK